jgi:hypothetical protein
MMGFLITRTVKYMAQGKRQIPDKLPCLPAGRNDQIQNCNKNLVAHWKLEFGNYLGFVFLNLEFENVSYTFTNQELGRD